MGRWEEVDVVADATDAAAENFGWPCSEGDERQDGWDEVAACQALPAAAVTPLRFRYEHSREVVPGDGCGWGRGSSISGIAFPPGYRGEHAGSLFFADYTGGGIFELRAGEDGVPDPGTVTLFARAGGGPGPAATSTTRSTTPSIPPQGRCTASARCPRALPSTTTRPASG